MHALVYNIILMKALKSGVSRKRKTLEQFKLEAQSIHGSKYDYSRVIYVGAHKKVVIRCPVHGWFKQAPHSHINHRNGCIRCGADFRATKTKCGVNGFIAKAEAVHGKKYDYSNVVYRSNWEKVIIKCRVHGDFTQIPYEHYTGSNCPKCSNLRLTNKERIERFKAVHGERYDYSLVKYINKLKPVKIICPDHGLFLQSPDSHNGGHGCQICGYSNNALELKLLRFLRKHLCFTIEHNKKFKWLGQMSLDVFIPDRSIGIEYQGIQHFRPVMFFGGEPAFRKRIAIDDKKAALCAKHNISLLYFTYKPKQIPKGHRYVILSDETELLRQIYNPKALHYPS